MDVVGPLRIEAVAASLDRSHQSGIVEVGFGDQEALARCVRAQLLQDVQGRAVEDRMHGVQAQAVEVVIAQPHLRVLDAKIAHRCRVSPVEVDRVAPGRAVAIGEVRTEARKVVALRTEVVVYHVQHHRQPSRMRFVHELLQAFGASVSVMRRPEVHAVVAPSAVARKLAHGHELDPAHSQLDQVVEMLHRARERPGGAEGADVQLVEDEVAQRPAAPGLVMPIEAAVVDGARGPVHPRRLPRRAGVGEAVAVQHVAVVGAVYGFGLGAIPASLAWCHG